MVWPRRIKVLDPSEITRNDDQLMEIFGQAVLRLPEKIGLRVVLDGSTNAATRSAQPDVWTFVTGQGGEFRRGAGVERLVDAEPSVDGEILTDRATWSEILTGRLAPVAAYRTGRLRIRGDQDAVRRIAEHFAPPDPKAARAATQATTTEVTGSVLVVEVSEFEGVKAEVRDDADGATEYWYFGDDLSDPRLRVWIDLLRDAVNHRGKIRLVHQQGTGVHFLARYPAIG